MIYKGKKLRQLIVKMENASNKGGEVWDRLHEAYTRTPAILVFPLGELIRPAGDALSGTIWAWALQGRIQPAAWNTVANAPDGLIAQGTEGLIEVEVSLIDALVFAQSLADGRCVIKCEAVQ